MMINESTKRRKKKVNTLSFSVNARVAMQLGRESISSSITAILELVKNSYDADAEWVRIYFSTIRGRLVLIIEDNGDGMDSGTLRDKWMVIGTADKTINSQSAKKRVKTGEKGLGRLGLDRLCRFTRVQSITEGAEEGVELKIDWAKYEAANTRLESVEHQSYAIADLKYNPVTRELGDFPKGTRLILMGLKDKWDARSMKDLHKELSFLVSPFGKQQDFHIELFTNGILPVVDGVIESPDDILDQAYWKISSRIDENNIVSIVMTSLQHEEAYLQSPISWNKFVKGYGDVPLCGPLEFDFYFFNRSEVEEGDSFTKAEVVNFLRSNQGIRIYRDGFRVKPYGEPNGDGDWLRLAYQRMQHPSGVKQPGDWRVGYNQVVGAVFITKSKNPQLVDQTNRESLVLGVAYEHLVIFAQKVVQFFQNRHQLFERSKEEVFQIPLVTEEESRSVSDESKLALLELSKILEYERKPIVSGDREFISYIAEVDIKRVQDRLSSVFDYYQDIVERKNVEIKQREVEKNTMSNLASLGILVSCFGHETLGWTHVVSANASMLKEDLEGGLFMVTPDVEQEVLERLSDLHSQAKKIHTFADFALNNVSPNKRRRSKFCVKDVAKSVFLMFEKTFQEEKYVSVDMSNVPSGKCEISAFKMDWESIFANLIVNSTWAMSQTPVSDRRIKVQILDRERDFYIIFDDSGFGLEADTENNIFEAGFSTKRNSKGEKDGTGMGLLIVHSFVVHNSRGTIEAFSSGDLGGARFVITVPKYGF